MSEHPEFFVGNRDPSISDTITVNGAAVDLTGKTVRFKAREVGSSTLLVDQPISNTPDATGFVRYDWSAADIASGGILFEPRTALIWWEVTSAAGKEQDVNEAVILVLSHAPGTNAYVELEELKSSAELTGETFADQDLQLALIAASRGIDKATGRRFYPDPDATQVRYYTPTNTSSVTINDLITLTTLATDPDGDGDFDDTWTVDVDFVLEPRNAVADGVPYNQIRVLRNSSFSLPPTCYRHSVKVTGKFGWAEAPAGVKQATRIIAARLVKRTREAPFGIVQFGAEGAAVRAASMARDPEIAFLLEDLNRMLLVA